VLGEEPGLGLPNQHAKACPRFQTPYCWCPPATGPGQPHQKDCYHYRVVPIHAFIGQYHDWEPKAEPDPASPASGPPISADWPAIDAYEAESDIEYTAKLSAMQAQYQVHAYNHALLWLEKQKPYPFAAHSVPDGSVLAPAPPAQSVECICAAEFGGGHATLCPAYAGEHWPLKPTWKFEMLAKPTETVHGIEVVECICDHRFTPATAHAAFCPLGKNAENPEP
jgi:hypothetical protein